MDSEKLVQANIPLAPRYNATTGQGEINLAVSSTAIRFAIPSWMAGKICDFSAEGVSVDVLEGDSTVDVEYNVETDLTAEEITADEASGRRIPSGQTKYWRVSLPAAATHISAEASGTGRLCISVSSQQIAG